jgi:hypothetical protein
MRALRVPQAINLRSAQNKHPVLRIHYIIVLNLVHNASLTL